MDLSNLLVVVVGVSSDIGSTLSKLLILNKAKVVGTYYKNKVKIDNLVLKKLDVTKERDVDKFFKSIKDTYGKIDILINMQCLCLDSDIYIKDIDTFMKVVKVNLGGTYLTCKYFSKYNDKGTIINISSLDGISTYNPISMDYSASKAGINNLTKNLALRFPNLKICALAPGFVQTKSVLEMDPNYLKEEMVRTEQKELISKESVSLKILEMLVNSDYVTGSIIEMRCNFE